MTKRDEGPDMGGRRRRARGGSPAFLLMESAMKLFVVDVGKARELLRITEAARDSFSASLTRPYEKRLDVRRKVAIEAKLTGLARSRWGKAMVLMKQDYPNGDEEGAAVRRGGREIYPVAAEQMFAATAEYLARAEAGILAEIQELYASNEHELAFASRRYTAITQPKLTDFLAESLLNSSVRSFKDFIGGLVRSTLLLAGSKTLGDLPPIPMEIVESYNQNSSTRDVIRWAIDRRVDEYVRSGPHEWRRNFQALCGVDLDDVGGDWNIIREGISRNELLGRGGRVDAQYVSELPESSTPFKMDLWVELATDSAYIAQLLTELEAAALCFGIRWAGRFFPDPDVNVDFPVDVVVDFESRKRWQHGLSVCDSLLDTYIHRDHPMYNIVKINKWFCKQEMGQVSGATTEEIRALEPGDVYEEMGKAALLRDWQSLTEAAVRYLERYPGNAWLSGLPLFQRAFAEHPPLRQAFPVSGSGKAQHRSRKRR